MFTASVTYRWNHWLYIISSLLRGESGPKRPPINELTLNEKQKYDLVNTNISRFKSQLVGICVLFPFRLQNILFSIFLNHFQKWNYLLSNISYVSSHTTIYWQTPFTCHGTVSCDGTFIKIIILSAANLDKMWRIYENEMFLCYQPYAVCKYISV